MMKKQKAPPNDAAQSARFVETAKALEADTGKVKFNRAVKTLIAPKARKRTAG